MINGLYHYTSVETLALVLASRKIRFRSLEKMDDLQENQTQDLKNAGRFVFVSCWTEDSEESIPMWKMYASIEAGIRLKMRKNPFRKDIITAEKIGQLMNSKVVGKGAISSLVSFEYMIKNKVYFPATMGDERELLCKVEYTSESEKLYPNTIKTAGDSLNIYLGDVGKYKNLGWSFQKEWRYILRGFPVDLSVIQPESMEALAREIIENKKEMPVTYCDINIDEEAFSEMEITLSPKISPGNRIIVENLIEKYNPTAKIIESAYKDLLS